MHWFECTQCKVKLQLKLDPPGEVKGTWGVYSSSKEHTKKVKKLIQEYIIKMIKNISKDDLSRVFYNFRKRMELFLSKRVI